MDHCWNNLQQQHNKLDRLFGQGRRDEQWQQELEQRNNHPMAVQNARIAVVRWHQDVQDTRVQIERSKQQWCTAAQEWLQYVYAHLFELP